MLRTALIVCLLLLPAAAPAKEPWMDRLGAIAIQDGGRVMPLDTYARHLAVQLTGRSRWSADKGPAAFAGRHHLQLFCDLLARADELSRAPLIAVENRPFKTRVGLDPGQKFFTAAELSNNQAIGALITEYGQARAVNDSAQPTPDQRRALDISRAVNRVAAFASGEPLAIVPAGPGETYRKAGMISGDAGTEQVRAALHALGTAYRSAAPLDIAVEELRRAIDAAGTADAMTARAVRLELLYNAHAPWRLTAVAYAASIIVFGLSRLTLRRPLTVAAVALGLWGVVEHLLGLGLRTAILGRVPVSNTYEALLWMGLVAMAVGLGSQILARGGWYLFGGLCASLVSVLFAGLVPLQDQTNALPAVLRSNFWLTVHVLTIVASYGVLAVAAVLGHVYLIKHVLLPRRATVGEGRPVTPPLIVQTYRTIQVGLVLLTAGTILGGVWAADSWGRFWGWDPKETWALISILVYLAVLHARHVRWLRDFGLAASAVLGFVSIVWCFYGVNYVMATGLHSYGFGSGGEAWVAAWVVAEVVFVAMCRLRYARGLARQPGAVRAPANAAPTAA